MTVTRELFEEAHAQLLARDQELLLMARHFMELLTSPRVDDSHPGVGALVGVQQDRMVQALRSQLAEQSEWAQRTAADLIKRDELIGQLQTLSAEQIAARDQIIVQLQTALEQQTAWAQRSAEQVTERDQVILQLQGSVAEQTAWAQQSADDVATRDEIITQLQDELQQLQNELQQLHSTAAYRLTRWLWR